jgi:hypothetical protein
MFDVATLAPDGDLADAAAKAGLDVETARRAFQPQRTVDLLFKTLDGLGLAGFARAGE